MKKYVLPLILGFILPQLGAFETIENTGNSRFTLQGELLYLKAVTEQSAFIGVSQHGNTVPINTNGVVKRITNDPDYRPGFRIEADWVFCDCVNQLQARYTHLYNGHKENASGLLVSLIPSFQLSGAGTNAFPGTAFSKLATHYNAGDLVWESTIFDNCLFDFDILLGLHTASIKYKENIKTYYAPGGPGLTYQTSTWSSRFWGIGPELGFKGSYAFPWICNLLFVGDMRGALLAGQTTADYTAVLAPAPLTFEFKNDPSKWGATPVFDGRLGLNYGWSCFCFNMHLEIGYEMLWYSHPIDKIIANSFGTDSGQSTYLSSDQFSDFSMHGPYAALNILF